MTNNSLPRGLRNCNPGNIRLSPVTYAGEVKPSQDAAFKQFASMAYGYRAVFMLLKSYIRRGFDTIRLIINRYAPPSENSTGSYVATVARMAAVSPDMKVDAADAELMKAIVSAISFVENGRTACKEDVEKGWQMASAEGGR